MREFSLEESPSESYDWLIIGKVTGITIAVYLGSERFKTNDREVQYYINSQDRTVFFQTINYSYQKLAYIEAGINWFVSQQLDPLSEIHPY